MASADGSRALVHEILPLRLHNTPYQEIVDAYDQWRLGLNAVPPSPPASFVQKEWDTPRVEERVAFLLAQASDAKSRARLLAVSTKESGAWLKVMPISSLGLRMDNETLRIAIGLRLGCPLSQPHACVHCGEEVDRYATHGLSCKWSQGRHSRHGELNDIIHRALHGLSKDTIST